MKNITVSLPDDVYRAARIRAAERDSSVSALVREYLQSLSTQGDSFERGRQLQAEVLARISGFDAGKRLTREQVHRRHAVR